MGYRLRTDLSKTAVRSICSKYLPVGVHLPSVRNCDMVKSRGTYWLSFFDNGEIYEAVFSVAAGSCYIRWSSPCHKNGIDYWLHIAHKRSIQDKTPYTMNL